MPHYLIQAAYTPEALRAMIQDPKDRTTALQKPIESLGGKIHNLLFSFGDYDAVMLLEMPNNVAVAAIALAIGAGGACKNVKTTPLMTAAEGIDALKQAAGSGYHSLVATKAAGQ